MNKKTLQTISLITTVASAGLTILTSWVAAKELDLTVTEKVAEAIEKANK